MGTGMGTGMGMGMDGGAIGGGRMSRDSDRMGGLLLVLFGVLLFVAAGAVAWSMMFEHGTTCASGGGPNTCTPKGGLAAPASLMVGAFLAALLCVPAVALVRAGLARYRR